MPTISNAVKDIISAKPLLYEAVSREIVNYANLAQSIKEEVDAEVGEETELPAIVMAIRRYAEKIKPVTDKKIPFKFNSEIIMKTGLSDITLVKTNSLLSKLRRMYELVDYDKGDTLITIQGNYELTVVINDRYQKKVKELLKDEKILNTEKDLVSISMNFSKEFLYTPGILARVTRELVWENINIFENISTMTELIFIISNKDAVRAYKCLQALIEETEKRGV
jgi:aspartokinase